LEKNMAKNETVETLHAPHGTPIVPKRPRHIAIGINHLVIQRNKAMAVRDKAAQEVKELEAALSALGWSDLPLFEGK